MAEQANNDNPGYETTDAHITPLIQTGIVIGGLVVVAFVSMIVLFKVFNYYQPLFDNPVPPLAASRTVSDGPRLQVDPPAQKIELDRDFKQHLESYGWVDEQVKIARIPVDRAIDLVSEGKLQLITEATAAQ